MRVLVVFDKFKDALSAAEACNATIAALGAVQPTWQVDACPLTDGGEGFAEILTRAANGRFVTAKVTGPRGQSVSAGFGLVAARSVPPAAVARLRLREVSRIGIVEMAQASGLALLSAAERDPWQTTTLGTGELIRAAADAGAEAILLGVGGSATNDLGLGALSALGVECRDVAGQRIAIPVPARWSEIAGVAGGLPAGFPPIRIACDVSNPLLGPTGCAAVYGPQKGLKPDDRGEMERHSARIAAMLCEFARAPHALINAPGAGAAGGIAFGLMAAARAELLPGFDLVSDWLDLERRIAAADVVVTGEGRFDASSLSGKGPGAVALRARVLGKRVHVFAGAVSAPARPGLGLHAITPAGMPLAQALAEARENLAATVAATFRGGASWPGL